MLLVEWEIYLTVCRFGSGGVLQLRCGHRARGCLVCCKGDWENETAKVAVNCDDLYGSLSDLPNVLAPVTEIVLCKKVILILIFLVLGFGYGF